MLGELTSEEIDEVLHSEAVGRIGCYAFGRPYVVPVTYAYDGAAVYAHSREGLKLRMMRNNPNVCFEVDSVDGCSTWKSVIALGTFSELEAREAESAMEILRRRFAPLVPSATSVPDGPHSSACRGRSFVFCSVSARGASRHLTHSSRAATALTRAANPDGRAER